MSSLNPNKQAIKGLFGLSKSEPVFMLNLLKFKERISDGVSGRVRYLEYEKSIRPILKNHGAEIIWAGNAMISMIGNSDWDMVVLVKYPTPRAFLEMVASKEYGKISHLRESALERTELIANHKLESND